MKKNKLILILVFLVIAVVGGFAFIASNDPALNSESASNPGFFSFGSAKRSQVQLDADAASDTLDNIARDSADIKSRFREVEEDTAEAERRFRQTEELIKQLTSRNNMLEQQLKTQAEIITEMQLEPKGVDVDTIRTGIISDLKSEIESLIPKPTEGIVVEEEAPVDDGTTRIRSITVPLNQRGELTEDYLKQVSAAKSSIDTAVSLKEVSDNNSAQKVVVDPRYTIFADSVLNDGLTLTFLNGRVPVNGDVGDPSPFKVIVGRENLSANYFRIPNLKGMLVSGVSYGDRILTCVRTKVHRVTYIFEDGRGITIPPSGKDPEIGYLTDPYGNPCIKGKYFTNKQARLKQTFLAGLASGAASAYASSEVSQSLDEDGNSIFNVTGDKFKYLAGVGISKGTDNVAKILEEDEVDAWDTVVAPSGLRVSVHIEKTLELDQTSIQRRVVYVGNDNTQSFTD